MRTWVTQYLNSNMGISFKLDTYFKWMCNIIIRQTFHLPLSHTCTESCLSWEVGHRTQWGHHRHNRWGQCASSWLWVWWWSLEHWSVWRDKSSPPMRRTRWGECLHQEYRHTAYPHTENLTGKKQDKNFTSYNCKSIINNLLEYKWLCCKYLLHIFTTMIDSPIAVDV